MSGQHAPQPRSIAGQQANAGQTPVQNAPLPAQNPQAEGPQGHLPQNLQHAFAHFHAVNQQLAAQINSIHNHPSLQGINMPQIPGQNPQAPGQPQQPQAQQLHVPSQVQNLQQLMASQQQARAHTPQQNAPTAALTQANMPPSLPGNTHTIVREHVGP